MDRVLTVFLMLWSSVAPDEFRLVGGTSQCSGKLQREEQGDWKDVVDWHYNWNLTSAAAVCQQLDCGSAVSLGRTHNSSPSVLDQWDAHPVTSSSPLEIRCSDSVRLVNVTNLCSGRLKVRSNLYNQPWSSVCEEHLDWLGAEVVCRELGCGAPSVLRGVLYEEATAPKWAGAFRCGGHESALLDCNSSGGNTCSSGKVVELSCSEPGSFRLVGGTSRCKGTMEVNNMGVWRPFERNDWNLRLADSVCAQLHCGSAVSTRRRTQSPPTNTWEFRSRCPASSLIQCLKNVKDSDTNTEVICSDSIRLVNGRNLCSGRLEVKLNQSWSSVCEDAFGQQDAEVVCRELNCGAPLVFLAGLYGHTEAPALNRKFQCSGHESTLLDCRSSQQFRKSCSPSKAVGLTCSDPDEVRLVEGASRCTGGLELRHQGEWKLVENLSSVWNLRVAALICKRLNCGSAVLTVEKREQSERPVWWINPSCVQSQLALKECVATGGKLSTSSFKITCSASVRLVDDTSLCSGGLEVMSDQRWSSVCEDDFGQLDAKVVCGELGCGAPVLPQGVPYVGAEALVRSTEFQCEGHESELRDCPGSSSVRNTCPTDRSVRLNCSDQGNIRLSGKKGRCIGDLELMRLGKWRPVAEWDNDWKQTSAAAVCRMLECGSVVSTTTIYDSPDRLVWWIKSSCVQSASVLSECVLQTADTKSRIRLEVTCSDLLVRPNISLSPSTYGVSKAKQQGFQVLIGSNFTITCSVEPQYQGGSFQLVSTTTGPVWNYTRPAVNHSAHFQFSAADHTHRGVYTCIYRVYVFSNVFSSESQPLSLAVSAPLTEMMLRLFVLLLGLTLLISILYVYTKPRRIQEPRSQKDAASPFNNPWKSCPQ